MLIGKAPNNNGEAGLKDELGSIMEIIAVGLGKWIGEAVFGKTKFSWVNSSIIDSNTGLL